MAGSRGNGRRGSRRRGRAFRAVERAVLGFVMGILAWAMERVVIRAMKKGRVKPAPRTAATAGEPEGLSASAQEVGYQPKG